MNKTLGYTVIASLIGAVLAVFSVIFRPFAPGPMNEENTLGLLLFILFLVTLGSVLAIIGIYKLRALVLVVGIGITTFAIMYFRETGKVNLISWVLLIVLYSFAFLHHVREKRPRVKTVYCDIVVLYSSAAGIYTIFMAATKIYILLLVILGILCPSAFYFLKRGRLSYQYPPFGKRSRVS